MGDTKFQCLILFFAIDTRMVKSRTPFYQVQVTIGPPSLKIARPEECTTMSRVGFQPTGRFQNQFSYVDSGFSASLLTEFGISISTACLLLPDIRTSEGP